jgi:hypothetical protein
MTDKQVLVNELVIGEIGTDRMTTVPCTVEEAGTVVQWFNGEISDGGLYEMLIAHPVLYVNEGVRFERHWPKGHASPWISVSFGDGGYVIYVPTTVIDLRRPV